jgi:ABC-type uncharacterized transport system permease subunit
MKIPDLSIEAAYVCGAIAGVRMLIFTNAMPLWISIILSFASCLIGGIIVGLTSSLLTYKAKFPHLLSSILTTGIFHGVNQFLLGTSNVSITSRRNLIGLFNFIRRYPELPTLFVAAIIIAIIGYLFLRTELGISLAVYGNNPRFFDNYGISSRFIFITGVMISNGLAGLAGFFDAQSSGFVDINMGSLKALFCITSIILGKTLVASKKHSSVWVPIVGSFSCFCITHFLLKINFNLKYFTMINALIVATILIINHHQSRSKTNHLGV